MKRNIYIILSLLFVFMGTAAASAQIVKQNNFDMDIYNIRNNDLSDFSYKYDDYLQYSPAAMMLGLKAFGYESRSKWGPMLVSDAFSVAIMAGLVNGIKYTVQRPRPDGSAYNSFPSGHTATSFMTATLLHKEYGWRSPWFSIGGYTVATVSAVSRILNNKHWMTDLIGGAAIGIGSVHLGYFLSDLIFKEKGLTASYLEPTYIYDSKAKHYVAELSFGHRHILGLSEMKSDSSMPLRGGMVSLSTDIPIIPNLGATARASINSLTFSGTSADGSAISNNFYSMTTGAYWNFFYAKRFEFQTHILAGAAWENDSRAGLDLVAGVAASFMLDSNFKVKLFADYEGIAYKYKSSTYANMT